MSSKVEDSTIPLLVEIFNNLYRTFHFSQTAMQVWLQLTFGTQHLWSQPHEGTRYLPPSTQGLLCTVHNQRPRTTRRWAHTSEGHEHSSSAVMKRAPQAATEFKAYKKFGTVAFYQKYFIILTVGITLIANEQNGWISRKWNWEKRHERIHEDFIHMKFLVNKTKQDLQRSINIKKCKEMIVQVVKKDVYQKDSGSVEMCLVIMC